MRRLIAIGLGLFFLLAGVFFIYCATVPMNATPEVESIMRRLFVLNGVAALLAGLVAIFVPGKTNEKTC